MIKRLLKPIYQSRILETLSAEAAIWLSRRQTAPASGRNTAVALVFPSQRGSVGDEAMAIAAASQLRNHGCRRIALISYMRGEKWADIQGFDEVRCRPMGWPLGWFGFCRWLSKYDALGVIGADVLDGYYSLERSRIKLLLAKVAGRLGLRTALLGFSYRSSPQELAVQMLRDCGSNISVLCRDPKSLHRVVDLTGIAALQSADLAFLLNPDNESPRVQAIVESILSQKARGRRVFGINCNRQAMGTWTPREGDRLVQAYIEALSAMGRNHRGEIVFVLVPHDSRGEYSDEKLGERIFRGLGPELQECTYLIPQVWSAAEIKAVASNLDAAITGRMHFAIACLGSGTPVASFEYQDKFAGMYDLFNLSDLCVPGQLSNSSESIVALLELLWERADDVRSRIEIKLPEIRSLSFRNIRALVEDSHPSQRKAE